MLYIGVAAMAGILVVATCVVLFVNRNKKPVETIKKEYALVFQDYAGNDVRFADFKKKPLVVFMWASWCPYCSDEIANLAKLKSIFGEDVNTVAVNRGEPGPVAQEFSRKIAGTDGIVFLLDPEDALYKSIGGYAMPETIFIDPGGEVVYHQRGPLPLKEASQKLNELLGR